MWEAIYALGNVIPGAVVTAIATGAFRNVTGWLQNALDDNVISTYEVKRLANSMIKYFAGVVGISLLATGAGVPIPAEAIAGGVFTADVVASYFNKPKKK